MWVKAKIIVCAMGRNSEHFNCSTLLQPDLYGPVTLSRTGSTYIVEYNNIVSGGQITSQSDLGDGLHTGTYLQRTRAGCHEQGTNIKRVNQPYVTE